MYQTLKHYGYGHSKVKKLRVFASIVEAYPRFGAIAVSYDKIVNMSASLKRFFAEQHDEDVASNHPLSSAFWKSTSPRYNMNDEGVGTSEEEEHDDDDLVSRLSDSLSEASLEDDEP